MKLKRCCLLLLWAALCGSLLGCNAPKSSGESAPPAPSQTASAPPEQSPSPLPSAAQPEPEENSSQIPTVTLYIGTRTAGFQEYPLSVLGEGTVIPDHLIGMIAGLTGWDLTLAEPVTDGKGGMSVCLASSSSLFQGPPDLQKDEFHMYSAEQLAQTILDSIQKTLQENFVIPPGDPDDLDVYFYMEGEKPLELPDLGLSWPLDQPYQWPR